MINHSYYGFNRHDKKQVKMLEHVLSLQGPARWRAAANLYLFLNPKSYASDDETGEMIKMMDAQTEAKIIADECRELRKAMELTGNKFGVSTNALDSNGSATDSTGGRRYMLRMPATMLQFIQMIDPTLLEGNPHERRATWQRVTKEFKEYQVALAI
jgi:hypothetical protein